MEHLLHQIVSYNVKSHALIRMMCFPLEDRISLTQTEMQNTFSINEGIYPNNTVTSCLHVRQY